MATITAVAACAGLVAGTAVWQHYTAEAAKYDLKELEGLSRGTKVVDREGHFVGSLFSGDRKFIKIAEAPQHLIDALIATEDARFYQHSGVDIRAVFRAFIANLTHASVRQGGSTITQQLARQAFELKGRTLRRKVLETFVARRLEWTYSKPQILEFYLNEIYLGSGFYGIGSAARGYFGKDVKDLEPEESAMLIGIIKAPVSFSPNRSLTAAKRVRDLTIDRMRTMAMITEGQAATMKAIPVTILTQDRRIERPEYVIAALEKELETDQRRGPFEEVRVTVNVSLQGRSADLLKRHISRVEKDISLAKDASQSLQGAVIVLDNATGDILASVGGRDYRTSPFDRALQGQRPAGTAFLPLAYASILSVRPELGSAWVLDGPLDNRRAMVGGAEGTLGEWGTEELPRIYEGSVSAAYALLRGKTGATVRLAYQTGVDSVKAQLQYGFQSTLRNEAPILLGSSPVRLIEVARAYSAIAMEGKLAPMPRLATRIQRYDGSSLMLPPPGESMDLYSPQACRWVRDVLVTKLRQPAFQSALEEHGLHNARLAGYGGTAYGFTDAWFVGFDRKITCAVWMGYDISRSMGEGAWSKDTAFPLWAEVIAAATEGHRQGWDGSSDLAMPDQRPKLGSAEVSIPDSPKTSKRGTQPNLGIRTIKPTQPVVTGPDIYRTVAEESDK